LSTEKSDPPARIRESGKIDQFRGRKTGAQARGQRREATADAHENDDFQSERRGKEGRGASAAGVRREVRIRRGQPLREASSRYGFCHLHINST